MRMEHRDRKGFGQDLQDEQDGLPSQARSPHGDGFFLCETILLSCKSC
jgi:hypothetical protein